MMNRKLISSIIIPCFSAAVLLVSSCSLEDGSPLYDSGRTTTVDYTWAKTADSLQDVTYTTFISSNGKYFKQNNTGNNNFNYWWNAHVMDVFVDGYLRTGDDAYKTKMKFLLNGIKETNGGSLPNEFYDDMEWLALSSLRAYEVTQDQQFLDASQLLWTDIKTGINSNQGGGIAWRKSQPVYKNTPANAPAIILASRLSRLLNKPEDLQTAESLYSWLKSTLVDPSSGLVWDGINRQGDGAVDKSWIFTYNQGTFIGAALELYKSTGSAGYLNDAVKTADNVIKDASISPGGLLKNENQGDGGLFKGILVRYLTLLIQEPALGETQRADYIRFLKYNAETFFTKGLSRPALMASPDWSKKPGESTDLSTQLSGLMLIEAAAALKEDGKF